MKYALLGIALITTSLCLVGLMTYQANSSTQSYCELHSDEAPNASHPECYCETDDETLPPGQGC